MTPALTVSDFFPHFITEPSSGENCSPPGFAGKAFGKTETQLTQAERVPAPGTAGREEGGSRRQRSTESTVPKTAPHMPGLSWGVCGEVGEAGTKEGPTE